MDFIAGNNQLAAHVLTEFGDMRLAFIQAELTLHPLISLPFGHQAAFPDPVKGFMRLDPLMAKVAVGQGAHGELRSLMGADIRITLGIAVAYVEIAVRFGPLAVNDVCRTKGGFCPAVGAANGCFFMETPPIQLEYGQNTHKQVRRVRSTLKIPAGRRTDFQNQRPIGAAWHTGGKRLRG